MIESVDDLLAVLGGGRRVWDGEEVDVLAHSLQCAELLAARAPGDIELQVAGLVHDVGTLLDPDAPATHAVTGGDAVAGLLGERVAALVRRHDVAKRYLVATDAAYRARLSARSVETLDAQGGPMRDDECRRFEVQPQHRTLVTLRRADDLAKESGRAVPRLDTWRSRLEHVAAKRRG